MSAVKRLAKAVKKQLTYLYNYTGEVLRPGMIIGFDKQGNLHQIGMIWEYIEGEADRQRAKDSIAAGGDRTFDQSDVVQVGFSVEVKVGGNGTGSVPGAKAKATAEVGFGIGGGCFLDVGKKATVHTLGPERLWLLQQAARALKPHHYFVEETVFTPHVAAATSGWNAKLQLAVEGDVDPSKLGIGNLAELQADGKLDVSVKSGTIWHRAVSEGTPLFRAWKGEDIPDLLGFDMKTLAKHLPAGATALPMDLLKTLPGAKTVHTLAEVEADDLDAFYDFEGD